MNRPPRRPGYRTEPLLCPCRYRRRTARHALPIERLPAAGSLGVPRLARAICAAPVLAALLLACDSAGLTGKVGTATLMESEHYALRAVTVVEGLDEPWSLAFLPEGGFLVTERPGRLRRVVGGALQPEPIRNLPRIVAEGQGGLLDVVLHPKFSDNRWVYISYVASGDGGVGTEVARGRLDGNALSGVEVVFRATPKLPGKAHFGSRLLFAPDGTLFITLGERYSERDQAQNLSNDLGKIVRLRDDGTIPPDNPFVGRPGARSEIYSYGHRNVQGIAVQPGTGTIWAHEHGPQGGDELNQLQAGVNYGWPVITYGRNYVTGTRIGEGTEKAGMAQPVHYWVPSIAPSGFAFYSGDLFERWRGNALIGSLVFDQLVRLEIAEGRVVREERLLDGRFARIRDVRVAPDGAPYLLVGGADGRVVRLEPAGPPSRQTTRNEPR